MLDFFADLPENIGGAIIDALRSLMYWLDTFIYSIIIYLYNWFMQLCQARLLDNTVVSAITNRFSIILGLFMVFCVAIAFIRMILDPDKISDKETGMGSIVKKVLLVVVMLGMSTTVFNLAFDFQRVMLGNNASGTNVIQNLLSPYAISSEDFGTALSLNLFTAFYSVDSEFDDSSKFSDEINRTVTDCNTYISVLRNNIVLTRNFDFGYACLNTKVSVPALNSGGQETSMYVINFQHILSVVVGIFVIYMLFIYCIKVGVRMVQLAFLEIISPMAIISYLAPTNNKDTMFSKWGKVYISTYIDVFIRVAIINLVVYLIAVVMEGWQDGSGVFWGSFDIKNSMTRIYLGVIMILALLTFAKRAPELLKEILPQGGAGSIGFGLSSPSKAFGDILGGGLITTGLARGTGFLGGAVGGVVGGAVGGGFGGAVAGLFKGAVGGLRNKKLGDTLRSVSGGFDSQKNAALRTQQRIAEGGSRFVMPGVQARVNALNQEKAELDKRTQEKSGEDNGEK